MPSGLGEAWTAHSTRPSPTSRKAGDRRRLGYLRTGRVVFPALTSTDPTQTSAAATARSGPIDPPVCPSARAAGGGLGGGRRTVGRVRSSTG